MVRGSTYADNAANRALGRAGMPMGSAPVSRASGTSSARSGGSSGRVYADNPSNRAIGRAGMPMGSAPISRGSSVSSTPRVYADNPSNRAISRAGMPMGSAPVSRGSSISNTPARVAIERVYAHNPSNRALGRAGMPMGSAPVSRGFSVSTPASVTVERIYADNASNRALGRAGMPMGSAPVSRGSSVSSTAPSAANHPATAGRGTATVTAAAATTATAPKLYADNVFNRRMGRVGLPLGSAVVSRGRNVSAATNVSAKVPATMAPAASSRVYVDNAHNRRVGRVGQPTGTAVISRGSSGRRSRPTAVDTNNIWKPLVNYDYEDPCEDNRYDSLLDFYHTLREIHQDDPDFVQRCDRAKGILNRHDASYTLTQPATGLHRPTWLNGGEVVDFADLALGERIGSGGFGDVHVAVWKGSYAVAVKVLRTQRVSASKAQAFQREVLQFSSLQHPAILEFYGACVLSPHLAIVMEFMPAGSLYDVLHVEERPLSTRRQVQMCDDILRALAYMHGCSVVHRDLKSTNVLVTEDFEHCKVSDFGCALNDESQTSASVVAVVGTLLYSTPELLAGDFLSRDQLKPVDVYAAGVLMSELFTGQQPFVGLTANQVRRAVCDGTRPSLAGVARMPASLQKLIEDCWAHEPARRPSAESCVTTFKRSTPAALASMRRRAVVADET
ncbi:kinase-like domain-containing protein [Tribonema minus]|uniref:Kinase-like domain-containing protein n=1 Tax=Tribonema minus TaxID=303371 RepID=A0A836C7Q0_9STRA|nr:kinase-like domain-containing protein [Tribonema minus]